MTAYASVFYEIEVIGFCKIGCQVESVKCIAPFIVFARDEVALVSVYLVGAGEQSVLSSHVKILVKIGLQRFQSVLLLSSRYSEISDTL